MRPVGLFGLFTMHDARARGDRAGDGVEVEVERLPVDRHLDGHHARLEHERLVQEPGRQAVEHLVARIPDDLERGRDRGEPARREVQVVGLERDPQVPGERLGGRRDGLRVTRVVGEPQLVLGDQRVAQDLDVRRRRRVVRVAEGEVEHARLMPSALVPRQPVEVVEQLERRRAGDGPDAGGGETGIHGRLPGFSEPPTDSEATRMAPMVLRGEFAASGLSPRPGSERAVLAGLPGDVPVGHVERRVDDVEAAHELVLGDHERRRHVQAVEVHERPEPGLLAGRGHGGHRRGIRARSR